MSELVNLESTFSLICTNEFYVTDNTNTLWIQLFHHKKNRCLYWQIDNLLIFFKENNKGKKDPLHNLVSSWRFFSYESCFILLSLSQPRLRGNKILKSSPWFYKYIFINNEAFLSQMDTNNQSKWLIFSLSKASRFIWFQSHLKMNIPY